MVLFKVQVGGFKYSFYSAYTASSKVPFFFEDLLNLPFLAFCLKI